MIDTVRLRAIEGAVSSGRHGAFAERYGSLGSVEWQALRQDLAWLAKIAREYSEAERHFRLAMDVLAGVDR